MKHLFLFQKNKSQLIIVASLIDKLPNLGGMARTSEVFGVNTLVVDSLRHLQSTQFQGLRYLNNLPYELQEHNFNDQFIGNKL